MFLIQWYIFRRVIVAFAAGLVVLTVIIWATQALQRLDLVTAKGQTLGLFLELTALAVPFLATLMAPIAFLIAMIAIYDQLNRDNEMMVMGASGASRVTLLAPALAAAALIGAAMCLSGLYAAPLGLKAVRVLLTEVRADLISSIVQPGQFIEVEDGLVAHIADRRADGSLAGLMLSDERDPKTAMTYLADTGRIVEAAGRTLLVMSDGSIQRLERGSGELSVAEFDAYAFDLTNLVPEDIEPVYKPSERTIFELLDPPRNDAYAAAHRPEIRVEIQDRFAQPLYPLVFALIAFVFVGDPHTNRQSRLAAVLAAGVAAGAVRFAGYGATTIALAATPALALIHAVPLLAGAIALWLILSDRSVFVHERIGTAIVSRLEAMLERLGRRPRPLPHSPEAR